MKGKLGSGSRKEGELHRAFLLPGLHQDACLWPLEQEANSSKDVCASTRGEGGLVVIINLLYSLSLSFSFRETLTMCGNSREMSFACVKATNKNTY